MEIDTGIITNTETGNSYDEFAFQFSNPIPVGIDNVNMNFTNSRGDESSISLDVVRVSDDLKIVVATTTGIYTGSYRINSLNVSWTGKNSGQKNIEIASVYSFTIVEAQ